MHTEKIEELKKLYYNKKSNYMEEYANQKGKLCYIFFSSNGLYDDNKFEKTIIENDRFEWKSIAQAIKTRKPVGKIIYVRDIYKKFYIHGINSNIDSIDKLITELELITKGYEVTTVGISSGGYLAVISAILLNAKRAFCFSGQFNIETHLEKDDLKLCKDNSEKKKWLDIMHLVKYAPNTPIYYFCPIGCEHDYINYQMIKNESNVKAFLFPDKNHAATVYPFNFPDLIMKENNKLDKLYQHYSGKVINKNFFYIKTVTLQGFGMFLSHIFQTRFQISNLKKKWNV